MGDSPTSGSNNWRSPSFRENIVRKLSDHIIALEMNVKTDARQMESNIFQKASSEHEYLAFIGRLIVYLREKSKVQPQSSGNGATNASVLVQELTAPNRNNNNGAANNCSIDDSISPAAACAPTTTTNSSNNNTYNVNNQRSTMVNSISSSSSSAKRPEPTHSQKLDILRTAIATVLQNPTWHIDEAPKKHLTLFGKYVAAQLSRIDNEEMLLSTEQKIMNLLNKAI